MKTINKRQIVMLIINKIKPQFPTTPEGKLMFAVVDRAIGDSVSTEDGLSESYSARRYLMGDIPHAEQAGVNVSWMQDLFKKYGLLEHWKTNMPVEVKK